jgi:hypothetical protein
MWWCADPHDLDLRLNSGADVGKTQRCPFGPVPAGPLIELTETCAGPGLVAQCRGQMRGGTGMPPNRGPIKFGVHVDVLKLGVVSLLTDMSSEMLFAVFAVLFTIVVAGSAAMLGLVEGLADFSASNRDYVADWLSDRSGQRKRLVLEGCGLSTLAKAFARWPRLLYC